MGCAWRNFKNISSRPLLPSFLGRNAKSSPIFHFDRVNNGWICHILCVKLIIYAIKLDFAQKMSFTLNFLQKNRQNNHCGCDSPLLFCFLVLFSSSIKFVMGWYKYREGRVHTYSQFLAASYVASRDHLD